MSRQFLRLCRAMPFSREQAGMAFAIAAIACLSSVLAHWSQQYPGSAGGRSWVRPLFGDLAEENSTATSPASTNAPAHEVGETNLPPTQEPESFPVVQANRMLPARQIIQPTSSTDSLITVVRFTEPAAGAGAEPQPVEAPPPAIEEAAWLSGGIELGGSD